MCTCTCGGVYICGLGGCMYLNGCRCVCRVGLCIGGSVHGGVDEWVFADKHVQVGRYRGTWV